MLSASSGAHARIRPVGAAGSLPAPLPHMRPGPVLALSWAAAAADSRAARRSRVAEAGRGVRGRLRMGASELLPGRGLLSAEWLRCAASASAGGARARGELAGEPSSEAARELSGELTLQLDSA